MIELFKAALSNKRTQQIIQYHMDGSYITADDIRAGKIKPEELNVFNRSAWFLKSGGDHGEG